MKRKVNRVGNGTLTVSIPSKWAEKNNLKSGDEIEITEEPSLLILSLEKRKQKSRKAILDISLMDVYTLKRYLGEFYRIGIEEITLRNFPKKIQDLAKTEEAEFLSTLRGILDRFIGYEIISQKEENITIQSLINVEDTHKIETVKKRTYFMIKDLLEEFALSLDSDFSIFDKDIYAKHDNIAKFIYYYQRLLHTSNHSDEEKLRLYGLYLMIDKVIDKLRHTSNRFATLKKPSNKLINQIKAVFSLLLEMFKLTEVSESKIDLTEIVKKRYELIKQIKTETLKLDEQAVVQECSLILDMLNDFFEANIILNLEKNLTEY